MNNNKNKFKILSMFILILSLCVYITSAVTQIDSCTDITVAGNYELNTSIIDSSVTDCINISSNNVTLDCKGYTVDSDGSTYNGIVVIRSTQQDTNVTIENCIVNDWVIWLLRANTVTIRNTTVWDNNDYSITIMNSDNFIIENCTSHYSGIDQTYNSIYVEDSDHGLINNVNTSTTEPTVLNLWFANSNFNNVSNTIITNGSVGVFISLESHDNIIKNSTIKDTVKGVRILQGDDNIFHGNIIKDSTTAGIELVVGLSNPTGNLFYNNIFNNTINVDITTSLNTNNWNTSKQLGPRIITNGTKIGGNYYTNSSSDGFSDTCTDSNTDGFCDSSYDLEDLDNNCSGSSNCDFLALSNGYIAGPPNGTLTVTLLSDINFNAPNSSSFTFSVNVSCSEANCGDFNLTLDPLGPPTTIQLKTPDVDNLGDTYIDSSNPNNNYGTGSTILGTTDAVPWSEVTRYSWLIKFNLSQIPANATILNASLSFYMWGESLDAGESLAVGAFRVYPFPIYNISGSEWTETTVTHNTRPLTGTFDPVPANNITIANGDAFEYKTIDGLQDFIQTDIDAGNKNITIFIKEGILTGAPTNADNYVIRSQNYFNEDFIPYLNITYAPIIFNKGIIPEDSGNPFYVNSATQNNPVTTLSLSEEEWVQVDWTVHTNGTIGNTYAFFAYANNTYNDVLSGVVNVTITEAPIDTCTYSTGDWNVDCSDNCVITTNTNLNDNILRFTGIGTFSILANITVDNVQKPTGCLINNKINDGNSLRIKVG